MIVEQVKHEFSDLVAELDTDGNHMLSYTEFLKILDYPHALEALQNVGVDPIGIVDFAEHFFLDDWGEPGEIPFEKFMEMVLDLRETNVATVKDLMNLMKQIGTKQAKTDIGLASNKKLLDDLHIRTSDIEAEMKRSSSHIEGQLAAIMRELQRNGRPQN